MRLDTVFRLEEKRIVSNDWVVRYDNRVLQLERQSGRPPARGTVLVYEAIDGAIEIRYRDRVMRWTEGATATVAPATSPVPAAATTPAHAVRNRPRVLVDHPWRRVVDEFHRDQQLAADRRAWRAVNP